MMFFVMLVVCAPSLPSARVQSGWTCPEPGCGKYFGFRDNTEYIAAHRRWHQGHQGGGTGGTTESLTDMGVKNMTQGLLNRDTRQFFAGAGATILDGLLTDLFSGSSSDGGAAQRRREEEERRRLEEIRYREEMARLDRIRMATELREEWERSDAEMSERLEGVFDVVPVRRSTPFFGIALADSPDPIEEWRDAPADLPGLRRLESQLRMADDAVPISDAMLYAGTITPDAAAVRRARETYDYSIALLPAMTDPRSRPAPRDWGAWKDMGKLMAGETAGEAVPESVKTYLRVGLAGAELATESIGNLGRAAEAGASSSGLETEEVVGLYENLRRRYVRQLADDPSLRQEEWHEKLRGVVVGRNP